MSASASVCVFCGSSPGARAVFSEVGRAVGAALAADKIRLVYGGGQKGIMGMVASGAAEGQGKILGIVPQTMLGAPPKGHPDPKPLQAGEGEGSTPEPVARPAGSTPGSGEGAGPRLLDLAAQEENVQTIVVDTMHARKLRMAQESDAFLVLPGGFGTFEEALEMITWNQIGMHRKPVVVVNVEGFFDPLRGLVRKGTEMGFIPTTSADIVCFVEPVPGDIPAGLARNAVQGVKQALLQIQSWRGGYWSWASDKEADQAQQGRA